MFHRRALGSASVLKWNNTSILFNSLSCKSLKLLTSVWQLTYLKFYSSCCVELCHIWLNRSWVCNLLPCCAVLLFFLSIAICIFCLLVVIIIICFSGVMLQPLFLTGSNKGFKTLYIAYIFDIDAWKMNLWEQVKVRVSGHSCLTKSSKWLHLVWSEKERESKWIAFNGSMWYFRMTLQNKSLHKLALVAENRGSVTQAQHAYISIILIEA